MNITFGLTLVALITPLAACAVEDDPTIEELESVSEELIADGPCYLIQFEKCPPVGLGPCKLIEKEWCPPGGTSAGEDAEGLGPCYLVTEEVCPPPGQMGPCVQKEKVICPGPGGGL